MKRGFAALLICIIMIAGCRPADSVLDKVLQFRQSLLAADGCSFNAHVYADYGDSFYEFSLLCQADKAGDFFFRVMQPDTIKDISGSFSANGGKLSFADSVLAFPALADGEVTPVSAPWLLYQTLRSGYIATVGTEDSMLRATIFDSYQENALQVDIWFDAMMQPAHADILWQGRRVLSVTVEGFAFM